MTLTVLKDKFTPLIFIYTLVKQNFISVDNIYNTMSERIILFNRNVLVDNVMLIPRRLKVCVS